MAKYPQEQIVEHFELNTVQGHFNYIDTDSHAVYYEYRTIYPRHEFLEFKVTIDQEYKECYWREKGNEDWLAAFTVEEDDDKDAFDL